MSRLKNILNSKNKALFLDRDGVINRRLPEDYVKKPAEFEFIPGVHEALHLLSKHFSPILVVTNQQGIGRGLMTHADLEKVHDYMLAEVVKTGGRIDKVYYSPDLKYKRSFTRKPAIGMGLAARKDFPGLKFQHSIMAGDTESDLLFGRRLGMFTILISAHKETIQASAYLADGVFPDLLSFAQFLQQLSGA